MICVKVYKPYLELIKEHLPSVEFSVDEDLESLFHFSCPDDEFKVLYGAIKKEGHNPFHVMTWEPKKRNKQCNKLALPVIKEEELMEEAATI